MTNSSFTGYARGEGFRPYKAPYSFLDRQREQDQEIIRNLQQEKREFDKRAAKSESDMARVFDKSEQMLAENQRIEDLYFANRAQALQVQAKREIEDAKREGINKVKSLEARAELSSLAPKMLDSLVKVKEGIDEARLEAATNYAIANIMPGQDPAYSAQVQAMRDDHDAINATADAMQKAGLPQRAVTHIRRSSNLTKYVELQQAAENLQAVYGDELKRRLLETVEDPNNPHEVAYAVEKIQIDLLKEHGLYGYNADFLHNTYRQMRAHRNSAIQKAEYQRDLNYELRETEILKNAAFADFNITTTTDYYKGLQTYRDKDGKRRNREEVLSTLFETFAKNPEKFTREKVPLILKGMDDGEGNTLFDRVKDTTRYSDFIRQSATNSLNDHRIKQGIEKVRNEELKQNDLNWVKNDWDGSQDQLDKAIKAADAQGRSSDHLKVYADQSNEARTDRISQGVMLQEILDSGRAGVDSLKDLPISKAVREKYLPLFQESGRWRDAGGTEKELQDKFKTTLQTSLKETSKQVSIEGLDIATEGALALYYQQFKARRETLGVRAKDPESVAKAAEDAMLFVRKQILDQTGDFRIVGFKDNRKNSKSYFPAFTPMSKMTPDGELEVTEVVPAQYFGTITGDPRSATIASSQELKVISQQIQQGIPVKIADKYFDMFNRFPGSFKSAADVVNNALERGGFEERLGPGVHEQLRAQTSDLALQRVINKAKTAGDVAMVSTILQGGPRITAYMSPKVSNAVGSRKFVLDTIASVESGAAGYNAVNQGGANDGRSVLGFSGDFRKMSQHGGRPLTDLTVREVLELQSGYDDYKRYPNFESWSSAGKLHAVGRYQFIGNTLPGLVKRAGISLDSKFDPSTQDRLALQLFKERGYSPWVGAVDNLSQSVKSRLNQIRTELNG